MAEVCWEKESCRKEWCREHEKGRGTRNEKVRRPGFRIPNADRTSTFLEKPGEDRKCEEDEGAGHAEEGLLHDFKGGRERMEAFVEEFHQSTLAVRPKDAENSRSNPLSRQGRLSR